LFSTCFVVDFYSIVFAKAQEKSSGNGGYSKKEETSLDMDVSLNFFLYLF
jgi:hypothetical protein